jgi:hypothetical protein
MDIYQTGDREYSIRGDGKYFYVVGSYGGSKTQSCLFHEEVITAREENKIGIIELMLLDFPWEEISFTETCINCQYDCSDRNDAPQGDELIRKIILLKRGFSAAEEDSNI